MKKILFICQGNIERSVTAKVVLEKILKDNNLDTEFVVDSKGLQGSMGTKPTEHSNISGYPDLYLGAKPILDELGIDIVNHISMPVTQEDINSSNLVIAMDKKLLDEFDNSLMKQFPESKEKFFLFTNLYGNTVGLEDSQYFTDEVMHRESITTIYKTLNTHWKELLKMI